MDVESPKTGPSPRSALDRSPLPAGLRSETARATFSYRPASTPAPDTHACGHGKVILLGEHAVVYGSHAIAAPIPLAIRATVANATGEGIQVVVPNWDVTSHLGRESRQGDMLQQSLDLIVKQLGLTGRAMRIEVCPSVPRAMGLGSSAAFAVALIRALDQRFELRLDDAQVNMLAFQCEELAHGTPSGIDNTVATYGKLVLYQRGRESGEGAEIRELEIARPLPLVIGISGRRSLTVQAVAGVREAWRKDPAPHEAIFQAIDALVMQGVQALRDDDAALLGSLMNACHAHLRTLGVSGPELEDLVRIARHHGALGAKLTGGGIGGSIIALCPENRAGVVSAIRDAGYQAMEVDLG